MIPFNAQVVVNDPETSYYLGQDSVSNRPIFVDPDKCKSPHMWVFGMTGAGKGMAMNALMTYSLLQNPRTMPSLSYGSPIGSDPNAPDWQIFDFHSEYGALIERMGGRVNRIGPTQEACINPLDFTNEEGVLTRKAVTNNSDFFLALMQSVMSRELEQREKSMLDRCMGRVYDPCIGTERRPTLSDLHEELLRQDSEVGRKLADAIEIYVSGSLSAFNRQTNVEHGANATVYDFSALGESMKTFALLSTLQHVRLRVFENNRRGRATVCVVEEVQALFDDDAAVRFLDTMFSELRKFGLRMICVTQLPRRVLEHHRASYLFDNSSSFVFLANLAENAQRIGAMFRLSESQLKCMAPNVEPGSGLVVVDGVKMAMRNFVPATFERGDRTVPNVLYEIWNTDPEGKAKRRVKDAEREAEDARL